MTMFVDRGNASLIKRIAGNIASGFVVNYGGADTEEIARASIEIAKAIHAGVEAEVPNDPPPRKEHPVKAATKPDPDVNERRRREFLKDGR